MSQYTTGEIAKLAGVTVRTVQYYDSRGILVPSDFSEGGRRLYNDADLSKLRVICFLRDLDVQINSIAEILEAENAEKVISLLLEQQLSMVQEEISEKEKQRDKIISIQKEMKNYRNFSIENLNDIAQQMENKKKLYRVRATMLAIGIPCEILELFTFILGLVKGIWWPYILGLVIIIACSIFILWYYDHNVSFICPECHKIFKPGRWESLWAKHTTTTRKLHCKGCGYHGYCVETYQVTESNKQES